MADRMGLYSVVRNAALRYYNNDAEKASKAVFGFSSLVAEYVPFVAGISRLVLSQNGNHKKSFSEIFPEYKGPDFHNIVSVPAGFDKYCSLAPLTYSLGFGWHVFGSISLHEWQGNNISPRVFSLDDFLAGWNRMELNNVGVMKASDRIRKIKDNNPNYVLFASVVQTPDCSTAEEGIKQICSAIDILYPCVDGFEINLSCPNTDGGKTFEAPETLESLIFGVSEKMRKKPVLLKLSPNLGTELYHQLIEVGTHYGVAGYVLTNTLPAQQWVDSLSGGEKERAIAALKNIGSAAWNEALWRFEGGISGKPLEKYADEAIGIISPMLAENQIIVGVGNFSPENIRQRMERFPKIKLVESYTRFSQSASPFFAKEMLRSLQK